MNRNPVGWFEIYVQDIDRAKRFYESVFQVKLERLNSPTEMNIELWSFPMIKDQMGASGALVKMADGPSGGNAVLVYFTCADCAVEAARATASGGQIVRTKCPLDNMALSLCSEILKTIWLVCTPCDSTKSYKSNPRCT